MTSTKWRPFCPILHVLNHVSERVPWWQWQLYLSAVQSWQHKSGKLSDVGEITAPLQVLLSDNEIDI